MANLLTSLFVGFTSLVMIGAKSPGIDPEDWKVQSVVYGEVSGAKEVKDTYWDIELKPLATLTGPLDIALVGTVTGEVQIFPPLTAIKAPPRKGAKVVVVIRKIGSNPIYSIENGHAGFFPRDKNGDQPCLFEVTGFDDPKVTETIDNLRKLRGKQRAEAEKAQAEKKVNGRQ